MKHYLNVCDVNGAEVEPVDVITFGSPCQDLSVAGKRAGLKHESNGDEETTRSGLFMEAVRIIKEMRKEDEFRQLRSGRTNDHIRPRFAVWENVPGAFSSNKGEDFRVVLEELARVKERTVSIPLPEKGKWRTAGEIIGDGWSIAWRTLDAQYHGVPQRRRRIFLVADFADECAGKILFECQGLLGYPSESREEEQGIAGDSSESIRGTSERECIGFDGYNATIGNVVSTLGVNCGMSTGRNGVIEKQVPSQTLFQPVVCLQGSMIGRKDENGPQGDGVNVDKSFTLNTIDRHAVAYGICSYASNSMKSSNPHSGIYVADTARTLDLNGGNPACNQGGICICEPVPLESGVFDVETEVYVRKYKVDCSLLCECLRDAKESSNWSNKEIAEQLNVPITKVEHWFRKDGSFAIPDADIWFQLKELLGITTDEFDESITTFVTQEGKYDMSNRIYVGDVSPTLTTQSADYKYLVPLSIENHPHDSRVLIREDGTVQSLTGRMGTGGGNVPLVAEPTYGMTCETFFSIEENKSPTLKARDYKDPQIVCYGEGSFGDFVENRVSTLKAAGGTLGGGSETLICEKNIKYIVRRLTPTECARLQGMPDEWCRLSRIDDMSDEDYEFWKQAHKTYAEINGKTYKEKTKAQIIKWYNKLQSDAPEYKAYGNGMAFPCVRVPIHGIAQHGAKTMASLFDGIGGFPLAGLIDGIHTLWTSEIELFPIAVTKERFEEYEKYGYFTFGINQNEVMFQEKNFIEGGNKEMELRVNEVQLPEQIAFNYEELKAELTEKVSMYETMVYTDEQIKEAKADKANLNKLKKALNDERIRREKEYMQPFNDFKTKINEIIGIIDKPVAIIDKQVKDYEEKQRQEKKDAITLLFNDTEHPEWLQLDMIFNERWLLTSTSMRAIKDNIDGWINEIQEHIDTLSNLPEFGFEATEVYKSTLDVNKAINEARRMSEMAKAKAAHESQMKAREEEQARMAAEIEAKKQAEQVATNINDSEDIENVAPIKPVEESPAKQWISFKALLSTEDAMALRDFLNSRGIEFKAV